MDTDPAASAPDALAELITNYFELNGSTVDERQDVGLAGASVEPSPLAFMRAVARNTPFVVRGGAAAWPAVRTWSVPFLRDALAGHTVNVAVTPNGRADAPVTVDGRLVFAQPWEEDQDFGAFLDHVVRQARGELCGSEVRYAQTQNDNLRHEYAVLAGDVPGDIPFASAALQRPPEAVNLWIGNAHAVTALHRDHYENIYVQVLGRKHFVLLPPLCQPCVQETPLAPWAWQRDDDDDDHGALRLAPAVSGAGAAAAAAPVPFPTWDPDQPAHRATAYSHLAAPMRVTLHPGDMLYLPAMWYHKVSQSASDEGVCVAVNYWYDMDFSGPLFPLASFVQSVYDQGKDGKHGDKESKRVEFAEKE